MMQNALIQGIVDALEQNERIWAKLEDEAKDTVQNLKDSFKKLRKSISWMRLLKWTVTTGVPVVAAGATGGVS